MGPFSRTVLLWRLERRLSQEALAKAARISRPNLSAVERGKREVTLKTLRALALALRVRPGVLVDGISPREFTGPRDFTRKSLERVVNGVVSNVAVKGSEEQQLVVLLKAIMGVQLVMGKGSSRSPRLGKRTIERAWLQLSCYRPEVIQGVIQRFHRYAKTR